MVHNNEEFRSVHAIALFVSSTDVAEYILAGSTAVEVGTANYRNPGVGEDLIDSISTYITESNWNTLVEMIGKVQKYN